MDLENVVQSASAGLVLGFTLGVSGTCEKGEEIRECGVFLEQIFENPEVDYSLEKLDAYKKFFFPGLLGLAFEGMNKIFEQNHSFQESAIFSIPATYVGRTLGSLARKTYQKRLSKSEKQAIREMSENPERALEYLPKDARERIFGALQEFEDSVVDSNIDLRKGIDYDLIDPIFCVTQRDRKLYIPVVMQDLKRRIQHHSETSLSRIEMKKFWKDGSGNTNCLFSGCFGDELKVYDISGDELNIFDLEVRNARVVSDGRIASGEIGIKYVEKTTQSFDPENCVAADYFRGGNKTLMIMKTNSNLTDSQKISLFGKSYLHNVQKY